MQSDLCVSIPVVMGIFIFQFTIEMNDRLLNINLFQMAVKICYDIHVIHKYIMNSFLHACELATDAVRCSLLLLLLLLSCANLLLMFAQMNVHYFFLYIHKFA